MTADRVKVMTRKEKDWWLRRLAKQFKDENDEVKRHLKKTNRIGAKAYGI